MRPPSYTPEEQDALCAPTPRMLRRPLKAAPPQEPASPRKHRALSPEERARRADYCRVYSARMRLKESLGMLRKAETSGDASAIQKARSWIGHWREGLSRVLRELGIDPATEELLRAE